jgi:AhpD family alkylhydroperoxidase
MSTRIKLEQVEPAAYTALYALSNYVNTTRLPSIQKELIKIRASQINGCAFCIDMHTRDARKAGETEQRIYALSAWRDTPFFTPEERALLALTEEVTLIGHHVSDATYDEAARHFDDQYLAQIIMTIVLINCWNRVAISTGMMPKPASPQASQAPKPA